MDEIAWWCSDYPPCAGRTNDACTLGRSGASPVDARPRRNEAHGAEVVRDEVAATTRVTDEPLIVGCRAHRGHERRAVRQRVEERARDAGGRERQPAAV